MKKPVSERKVNKNISLQSNDGSVSTPTSQVEPLPPGMD